MAASMDLDIKEINWKLEGPIKYMPEIVSDQTLDTFDKASIDEENKKALIIKKSKKIPSCH